METCVVLMSTYNGEKYVVEQINSILAQKNVRIELFVRDDGSTDSTIWLIENMMRDNKSIHLYKGSNIGITSSFREIAKIVNELNLSANYYAFADQDDVWLDQKLNTAIVTLKKCRQNQALLYYSNLSVVDENLNYKFQRFKKNYVRNTKKSMLAEINVLGCTCVFNKKLLKFFADSSFESDIPHDAWIALQGMFLGKCLYDERSFILYRQHGNNGSGQVKKGKYKIQDYVKKIKELDKMQGDYEHFANEFLENYKSILNPTDKKMFEALINYRDNILIKIKLFLPFYINSYHLDKEIARRVRMMKGIL